ncbi:hypothetical protein BJ508DRAFT_314253 [Ascobolus immersus RN42]|uniref:Uncharacterized protein n=1 Tax=Ascobolus immersus RN42 TaxID=1160509 RepID=A0A3N4HKB3_ASCIM|nr:hypothetical protein BJ508DRAFT_314253 [Ascobolus immersus RN42]
MVIPCFHQILFPVLLMLLCGALAQCVLAEACAMTGKDAGTFSESARKSISKYMGFAPIDSNKPSSDPHPSPSDPVECMQKRKPDDNANSYTFGMPGSTRQGAGGLVSQEKASGRDLTCGFGFLVTLYHPCDRVSFMLLRAFILGMVFFIAGSSSWLALSQYNYNSQHTHLTPFPGTYSQRSPIKQSQQL